MTEAGKQLFSKSPHRRSTNKPYFSRWERAKFRMKEGLPHPIQRWKQTDSRVINLFVGAAVAAPGFVAIVGGASQVVQNQDILDACENRPTATALQAETCARAQNRSEDGVVVGTIGGVELLVVGTVAAANHRRLSNRLNVARSSNQSGATGPNPPTSPLPPESSFQQSISR